MEKGLEINRNTFYIKKARFKKRAFLCVTLLIMPTVDQIINDIVKIDEDNG
jgi:hypothetical protein